MNMLKALGTKARVAESVAPLEGAVRLILTSVARFDHGMAQLEASGFIDTLNTLALEERLLLPRAVTRRTLYIPSVKGLT